MITPPTWPELAAEAAIVLAAYLIVGGCFATLHP
jgi:hypothetical protein